MRAHQLVPAQSFVGQCEAHLHVPGRPDTNGSGWGSGDGGHSFPIPNPEKISQPQKLNSLNKVNYIHTNQPYARLSGGEKSLTVMALLMATFRYQPVLRPGRGGFPA